MLKLKPVLVTVLTLVCFVGGLALGTTSDWWQTEGRKTPLDAAFYAAHDDETAEGEEEAHSDVGIFGSTTVQQAMDLGIPREIIEQLLEGPVEDPQASIKVLAQERGLQFGVIKDELNAFLGQEY